MIQKPTVRGGKAEVIEVPLADEDKLKELIADTQLFEQLLEVSGLNKHLLD